MAFSGMLELLIRVFTVQIDSRLITAFVPSVRSALPRVAHTWQCDAHAPNMPDPLSPR
jgi:hypothetical protein